jgi:hypothetical protein
MHISKRNGVVFYCRGSVTGVYCRTGDIDIKITVSGSRDIEN